MRSFKAIYDTACLHKGGPEQVEVLLPKALSAAELAARDDAYYLSHMSLRIFRAGLKHSLVDAKWPRFERVFHGFEPMACAMLSDEFIEQCMGDKSLIRHLGKIKSIRANAQFIEAVRTEHGSFAAWLAAWPLEATDELWAELKKRGSQLGGASAGYFLRMVGRDTYLLTNDVAAVLELEGVIDKRPVSSKKELARVQQAFNQWRDESGRSLCEISRVLAMTVL
ncbi:DNA-3-methyladenine glycosylase I [Agaribacterium haliotis]|uniref:DNA-3-methyladenine glycosylase I n=1 Tax=Agaribacterium haliotis TaxID=2013869 RepID=UPI000BB5318B|nr:DNA-3-methyladenine glycosylase I [Agaribacterium haliotis]